jgi:membrane associated rhomboid family serine protease
MGFFDKIKSNFQEQGTLTQIIVVNVAVFLTVNVVGQLSHLVDGFGNNLLLKYLALPIGSDDFLFKFWTLFTYMFTHESLGHLFWNMVLFYFMSQVFFTIMGQKKLLYLYVMSGLSGGVLMLLVGLIFRGSFGNAVLLGASAAVMGVGAVMAVYAPNYRVYLFGAFEIAYKYFFGAVFVLNTIIDLSENTGGKISHIGGTVFGLIYGYYLKKGTDLFDFSFLQLKNRKLKVVSYNQNPNDSAREPRGNDETTMDELLDKISKSGYDSLTKKEKDQLFKLSQKK